MTSISSKDQLDEYGQRIQGLVAEELEKLGRSSTTWTIVQTGECPHPNITLLLEGRNPVFQIDREEQAFGTTNEQLREKIRLHLEFAFRAE